MAVHALRSHGLPRYARHDDEACAFPATFDPRKCSWRPSSAASFGCHPIHFIVVTPPHCDNHNNQTPLYDFIDQSIPRISELDFVYIKFEFIGLQVSP